MGYPMRCKNTEEIWNEMCSLTPKLFGATYEKIDRHGSIRWPCWTKDPNDTGTDILHKDGIFTIAGNKGFFKPAEYAPVKELEDADYPISLSNFHDVGHHSMRSMTGNCRTLRNLEDEPGLIELSPDNVRELGIESGDIVRVVSRRGHCYSRCFLTSRVKKNTAYMTHQWWIGAVNELTVPYLDPQSKTPEFKYCAVKVEKIDNQDWVSKEVARIYDEIRAKSGIDEKTRSRRRKKLGEMHTLAT
jgi:formate dehydrogenase major subunit